LPLCAGDSKAHACENASNHDPTAKLIQRIDFVRKDESLAGSFFARNVTPSRQGA